MEKNDNVVDINTKKPPSDGEKQYSLTLKGVIYVALLEELGDTLRHTKINEINQRILEKIIDYGTKVAVNENEGGVPAVVFPSPDNGGIFTSVLAEPRN